MPKLVPVDYDPFADDNSGVKLTPVDFDPFVEQPAQNRGEYFRTLGGTPPEPSVLGDINRAAGETPVEVAKTFVKTVQQAGPGAGGALLEYTGHLAERYPGEVVSRPDLEPDSLLGEHTGYFTGPATRTPISTQDPLTQFAKIGGKAAREYWTEASKDPILKSKVESFTDIKSVADGIRYGAAGVGNLAGSVALITLMPGMYAPEAMAGVVLKEGVKKGLGGRIINFLKPNAMDVPIGWMEAGEIAGKQLEEHEKNGTDLSLSRLIATAVPATLVERGLGVEAAASKFGKMGPEFREFSKKHLIPRILEGMGVAGFGEGAEEFVQTYLENYGGNPKSVWTKETLYEALNAGLQGMIGGHVMGGAGGAAAGKQYRDVQNQQKAQQEILANPVDFQHPAAQKMIENRANVARHLEDFIAETDPQLAKAWGEQATLAIGANRPVDMSMLTNSGKFDMTDFSKAEEPQPVAEPAKATDPVAQEIVDDAKYKPIIDQMAAALDSGEASMEGLQAKRDALAQKHGEGNPLLGAIDRFILKRNMPPGVKDGMDMVNKALVDPSIATDPIYDAIAGKMRGIENGVGGRVIKNLNPIDRMADQFEQQFPQVQRPSFAGITRKQPGMPRPRAVAETDVTGPAETLAGGRRLGGEPIAMPGQVAYTAKEQRRPSETALLLPEKERIHRAIFESLEHNDDHTEGMTPMLVESYLKEGGIIPANRADLAARYPSASFAGKVDVAANEAATSPQNDIPEPTEAEIQAGNYRKGHVSLHGLDISIENPKGSMRRGVSKDGNKWESELKSHYGYIRRTEGVDGDAIDVFIGDNPGSQRVFVVYQNDPATGKFDEHKAMLSYNTVEEAKAGYLANYEPGWKGLGAIVPMSMDTFKAWLNKTAPFTKAEKKTPAEASVASAQMEAQPGDFYEFDVPTRPGGPKTFRYKVRSLFVQNDGTIVPLVKDLRSETVYPIFPSIAVKGRFVKGDEGVVEGSFPMGTKPKEGTPIPAPTESAKRSKTLIQIIIDMGGLSAAKVKAAGFNVKEDFQQHRLSFVFRKNGRSLDDIATELVSSGVIPAGPDTISSDNYTLSLLQAAARGEKTTVDQMKDQLSVVISEQKDDILELKEDLKRHGANESQIEDVVRTYQDATREDTRPQETDQDAREARTRGAEALDDDFVSEVEEPTEVTPSELRPVEPSEEGTANTPAEGEKRAQTPQGEETGGELFNTSGMFSLSGNQPVEQKTMKVPEKKGERMFDVEKQTTDELKDRLSGEKAKREFEEGKEKEPWQMTRDEFRKQLISEKDKTREEYERLGGGVAAYRKQTRKQLTRLHASTKADAATNVAGRAVLAAERLENFDAGRNEPGRPSEHREAVQQALSDGKPVPEEVLKDYPELEEKRVSEKGRKIEDAGEELVYNKRNRVKTGKTWDDISGLNDALKAKETTKNNVWPKPDYEQIVQGGTPATIAHIFKQVYDSIANAPVVRGVPTDPDFKLYIDAVQRVRDGAMSWMNNPEAIRSWAAKQAKFAAAMMPGRTTNLSDLTENAETQSLLDMVYPGGWRNFKAELTIIGGNKVYGALQPGRDEVMRAMKAEKKGWPGKMESWQVQGLKVMASSEIKIEERNYVKHGKKYIPAINRGNEDLKFDTREQAEAWTKSLKPFLLVSKYDRVISEHDTRESAVEAARERVKKDKKSTISDKGISVAAAERQGPSRRMDGEDITAERLSADFGFRGVNFGNWMPDNERQLHLNHAYDSFHDLAEILDVPPKALSLNGMLGIAFGAQGTGQYAAHFVPGVNEINLTRTSGAGSISHEWGHALDHYFAAQGGLASATAPFLSEYATSPRKIEGVRPEIVEAFKAIVSAMNKRPQTPQEARQKREQSQKRSIDQLDKWLQFIRQDFVGQEEAFDKLADRIRNDDYGEGYVAISPKESIYPVLSEIRELYKKAKGRTYTIDSIKALRNWMDTVRYSKNNTEAETEHVAQVTTDYASNALKLDKQKGGKPYWSTNTEKFARAFDAYVSDRIAEKAITNTYLSHQGREDETVPMGKEREATNKAFDALVDAVETRETDKGVMFFKKESSDLNKSFADRLDKFLAGEMGRRIEIVVTNTPAILSRLGAKQLPITISDYVIDKAMRDKHAISLDTLKQLPMALHDPIAVFKSGDVRLPNALVIMTEIRDKDGETVVVAVHLSKQLAHHEVNRIASLYGKDDSEWFQKQADKGRALYVNKEKAVKWSQSVGQLFLPKEATRSGSEKSILTEKDFVKKGEGEDGKPSFRTAVADAKKGPYKAANLQKLLSPTITRIAENTGVTVKVIQDNYGFPADFIERAGADFDLRNDRVYGAYDPLTNTIYLVADNAESTSAVEKTLFEELVGHKGLPAFLGREKTAELRDWVYSQFKNSPDMQTVIRDYGLDVTNAEDRRVAGNEFMIHHVGRPTIMQRVIAYIREALRRMGFKMRYSDADLKTLVGSLMNRVEASMMGERGKGTATEEVLKEQPAYSKEGGKFNTAFRKWFGDWERARKYKAIIDMEPVRIGAKPQTESDAEMSYKALKPASNVKDGRTIHFPNSIFGKLSRHKEHALIFRTIPQFNELLHDAEPAYFEAERKEERKSNVVGMHNYVSKITIDGTDYFVRFSVQEVKKPNGNELHNAFVSDVELIKADLMKGPSGHTASFNAPATASPTSLLDKVLASFMKDVKEAYETSSKVVDENGEPLVVYHGTASDFESFRPWSHFGTEQQANFIAEEWGPGGSVIPTYLNIKNPLRMHDTGFTRADIMATVNPPSIFKKAELERLGAGTLQDWEDALREKGYDGIIYRNTTAEGPGDSYVAFSPTQIKSVYNQGTWSAEDDRISFKKGKSGTDDALAFLDELFEEIERENKSTEPLGKPTKDIPDPTKDRTKKTESWLNQETAAIFRTIASGTPGNMPHNSFLENVLKSPEWYEHPVFKNIVRLFTMDRERLYHTTMLDLSTIDDQSVIEETDQLRKKNPAAYKELLFAIDYGDTRWKRGDASMERLRDPDISEEARAAVVANQVKKYETYLREKRGVSPEAIRVWKLHRASYDKALDMMTAQLRELVAQMEEGEPTGQTKTVLQELRFALASMNEWRGFYAPRLRERAGYAVQAEKTVGGKTERYREHKSKYGAERLANKLRSEGWQNVRITEISRLPESVYMNLKAVDVAKAIKDAAHGMKGEAAIAFNDELIEHVSNLIKSRGYRSSMIHRGSPEDMGVVRGYMEDPLERYTTYVNNLAGGFSKSQVAQRAMQMLLGERSEDGSLTGGIDAKAESRTYVTAERYIAEQLRNLDQTDRIVGIAKSIATFKYLGFNPRSMLVNMTAMATTVPPAIYQYVMGGKGSMTKALAEIARSGADIATVMAGRKLKNDDEQAFIERIKREGYDDPQLTRDIMGKIGSIHQRAWSKMMGAAMWAFGKTEQWNRMSTMLAGYRIARGAGKTAEEAHELALDASNKAHGLYGRSTLPAWAQGGNPAAKAGQMMYVYGKFGHNYLQMMYDLGFKKHDIKATLWGFASPIILAGGAAWPLKDLMIGLINAILHLLGFKGDTEKFVYDGIRTHLGKTAEMGARHGITGLAGIDISGSLSIGVGVPRNMWELTGAAGGVYDDAAKALHFLSTGQPGRAAEKALPTAGANFLRAAREGTRMVTSEKGRPLYDDDTGRPLQLSAGQMTLRAAGFRPSEQAVLTERRQEHRELVKGFTDRRDEIYEQARAYYADPDRDSKGMTKLMQAQTDYNQSIRDADLVGLVPFMKYSSLRDQARSLRKVDKRERARLRRDAE